MPAVIFDLIILTTVGLHIVIVVQPYDRREGAVVVMANLAAAGLVVGLTPAGWRWLALVAFLGPYGAAWLHHWYVKRQMRQQLDQVLQRAEQREQVRQWEENQPETATESSTN